MDHFGGFAAPIRTPNGPSYPTNDQNRD